MQSGTAGAPAQKGRASGAGGAARGTLSRWARARAPARWQERAEHADAEKGLLMEPRAPQAQWPPREPHLVGLLSMGPARSPEELARSRDRGGRPDAVGNTPPAPL